MNGFLDGQRPLSFVGYISAEIYYITTFKFAELHIIAS